MNAADAKALRATFLLAFDDFATDPTGVASLPEVGNVRYARELLGTLVHANLVVDEFVNGEEQVWQAVITHDNATRAEAEALIDGWLAENGATEVLVQGTTVTKASPRRSTRSVSAVTDCLCGCGIKVGGKAAYRPGHDARHASQVAKRLIQGFPTKKEAVALLNTLPSQSLRDKAEAQVARGLTPKAKAPRHSLVGQPAWVKVGRWIKQGEVTGITVNAAGKETQDSEVCVITYQGKKGTEPVSVQVDGGKHRRGETWDLGQAHRN